MRDLLSLRFSKLALSEYQLRDLQKLQKARKFITHFPLTQMDDFNASTTQDQAGGHKALLELEVKFNKKSRSTALSIQGSQIQALTSFIHIFEQYPYPVVINAAILKLADWFRTYNNNVKYYVYKVFKEASDLHLTKLINIEETVRRILPILGSNDPIARSITLRVLGCMSMIIADKLDVQFGIIQRLELATDRIELEAAIWAGDQICARSNRFPSVIFSKLAAKLENPDTPFDTKLRLVKIFRHMHQDIGMARQAKLACLKLLDDPATDSELVIVTLRTLTLLLSKAIIDRKEQIDRLLNYALNDAREEVRYNVLYDLYLLGKNDIMFDETHILGLLQVMMVKGRTQQRAFTCAQNLIESHQKLITKIITSDLSQKFYGCLQQCENILIDTKKNYMLLIACAKFLYTILRVILVSAKRTSEDAMDVDMEILPLMKEMGYRIAEHIKRVDLELINQDDHLKEANRYKLKQLLKIKADFCLLLENWDCDSSFKDAYTLLTSANDEIATVLLPYLSSISRKCTQLSTWFPQVAIQELKKRIDKPSVYVNLTRLFLRTTTSTHELTATIVSLLKNFGQWDSATESFLEQGWNIYLIGMEAGSCGWYELMHIAMTGLCKKVNTEACLFWLRSLSSLAYAEWKRSTNHYLQSLTELKVLASLDLPRTHQAWFIQLRMETRIIIQDTLQALDKPRYMEACASRFRRLAYRYDFLAQSQFGIQREMLQVIESYKICALVCEHAARSFSGASFFCIDPSLIPLIHEETGSLPMRQLCREFMKKVTGWEEFEHLDEDHRLECTKDMKLILETFQSNQLILPKAFFENRKSIAIQLATEPMLNENKPVTLQTNQDLVIKFEGLVLVAQHVKYLERKIQKAVIVCFVTKEKILNFDDRLGVNMIFADPTLASSALLQPPTTYIANVRNSYFTYTGLLSLPKSKDVTKKREAWINVFVKLLDENSGIWSVGPQQWGKVVW